ncbi:MAG: hybrid sensor histidine kinase/response regulator [Kouleothrix sp.]|jgi:signal transduction histidine kinase|nr:hybrid sensor histidine kinase/response regulator [Kouleothrix sp.]
MRNRSAILYIEDNADNQRLVRRILESRGYTVQIAVDGPDGLAQARSTQPALILVDINIPGLDGYETTTRLRGMGHLRGVPIVAVTADVREGARERSLVAGCDGYITKPIDPRELPEQLQEFIAGKREALPQGSEAPLLREYNHKLVERLEHQVRELMAANAELQELDQLKSQFLATLSHELRTPLTSILGYLDLFERGTFGTLSEVQGQALTVVTRNAHTLARQLNNLLYLQEVRSSQIRRVPVAVHDMALRLVAEHRARAAELGVSLESTLQPTQPYPGDAVALEQALRNLIDNALKFTPGGGFIRVTLNDDAARLIVRVDDSGMGIPAEALEKIFLPFYQVDSSLARPHPGAGLGLAIVKHVIEAHDGFVSVRSAPGSGSSFSIVLPRPASAAEVPAAHYSSEQALERIPT